MSDVSELESRIEGAFSAVKDKTKQKQQEELQAVAERQKLLKDYEKAQAKIVEIAKPRLEALAKRAGERAKVSPSVSQTRRSATFEFKSPKAFITLAFSVVPDQHVKNAVVESELKIVPVLWKYDSHSEFRTPIAKPDTAGLTKWLDDRIVSFVELYIQIHEGEIVEKSEMVEDPIAKVKFPKFAARATLEQGGQTYYFIDEHTKSEFAKQKGTAK